MLIMEGILFAGVINKKAVEDESDDGEKKKVNKNLTVLILIR